MHGHTDAITMQTYSQEDIDQSFADMEFLLAEERHEPYTTPGGVCCNCGCPRLLRGDHGESVCNTCGAVQPGVLLPPEYYYDLPRKHSNYKRIHHWHERISQLLLLESAIPDDSFARIAKELCSGKYPVLCKESIRSVLRSLNMPQYIEKWLQVIHRMTGVMPPMPGPVLVQQLDNMFIDLQRPFHDCRPADRKNFLNYNYTFNRLFQKLGCTQFCMFFPLIKSKAKLRALDYTWRMMTQHMDWPFMELQLVAPFAVKNDVSVPAIPRLAFQCESEAEVERPSKLSKTQYHVLRRMERQEAASASRAEHRLDQPARKAQKFVSRQVRSLRT